MSKLLFDEAPLVVDASLATKIGLNEAIVLQQIHYWVEINRKKNINFYDGFYWTYNSIREWNKFFPFFGEKTLKRVFSNLEGSGLLKSCNYNKKKMDRTKWYTIDYKKLEVIVSGEYICELQEGEKVVEHVDPMQKPKKENAKGQFDPMQRDNLTQCKGTKRPNAKGQNDPMQRDNLTQPIPEITTEITTETSSEITTETSTSSSMMEDDGDGCKQVVAFFEENFYMLKKFDGEVIAALCNAYDTALVIEAMKVAKKNGARALSYIEKTLINWNNDGITTVSALDTYNQSKVRGDKNGGNREHTGEESSSAYAGIGFKMSDLQ